jgi:hypothetical protein
MEEEFQKSARDSELGNELHSLSGEIEKSSGEPKENALKKILATTRWKWKRIKYERGDEMKYDRRK